MISRAGSADTSVRRTCPACSVNNGDVDILPADAALAALTGAVAADVMANAVDAAELFDIDTDQLTWLVALIADGNVGRRVPEGAKPMCDMRVVDM